MRSSLSQNRDRNLNALIRRVQQEVRKRKARLAASTRAAGETSRWIIAVDLLPLRPGGENGGHKPAVFTLLRAVAAEADDSLVFVFLTNFATHAEVRQLARPVDMLICVAGDLEHAFIELDASPVFECKIVPPPQDLVRAIGADLLYCPFGAASFYVSRIPTIAFITDVLHKDYPFTLDEAEITHREKYIQHTVGVATKIQCNSRTGMERLVDHYRVPGETLFYTYLPVHGRLEHGDHSTGEICQPDRPFFFYPANLWLHKNHEILLLSFARYLHEAGDGAWQLVLTHHEDERAEQLELLARRLGISDHVHFAGFVTDPELKQLWQTAGALVFPSLHEGFGIPLLEAMHYGVPIICGNDFSLEEVAGDASYYVDPRKPVSLATALLEISRSDDLRAELIRRGRERLRDFDLEVAAKSVLEAFDSAIQNQTSILRNRFNPINLLSLGRGSRSGGGQKISPTRQAAADPVAG